MDDDIAGEVRRFVTRRVRRAGGRELPDDFSLSPLESGLDSIALLELLLACEEHFGFAFPPALLDAGAPTIGRLVQHARQMRQPGGVNESQNQSSD
jgi:acyl carrier protein